MKTQESPKTYETINLDIVERFLSHAEKVNLSAHDIKQQLLLLTKLNANRLPPYPLTFEGLSNLKYNDWFTENYPQFDISLDDYTFVGQVKDFLILKMTELNIITPDHPFITADMQILSVLYAYIFEVDNWSELTDQAISEATCEWLSDMYCNDTYTFDVDTCLP